MLWQIREATTLHTGNYRKDIVEEIMKITTSVTILAIVTMGVIAIISFTVIEIIKHSC